MTHGSFTVSIHELPQRRVFFYLELNDSTVLAEDFKVNVLRLRLRIL